MKKIIFFISLGLFFYGCTPTTTTPPQVEEQKNLSVLANSDWTLSKIDGKKADVLIVEGSALGISTLKFDENSLTGNSGVNRFSTMYKVVGNSLETTLFISTKMAAFNPLLANNEQTIFTILQSGNKTFELTENALLVKSDKGVLEYGKTNPLKHSSWTLKSIAGKDVNAAQSPSLAFSDKRVWGVTPVNDFSGSYKLSDNDLNIEELVTTQKLALLPELNKLEKEFVAAISNALSFEFGVPSVLIVNSSKGALEFGAIDFKKELDGTVWQLVTDQNTSKPTLGFRGNALLGNGGVNNFRGTYAIVGRNIYISPLAASLMAGKGKASADETAYFKALSSAEYFELNGNILTLKGESELTFRRGMIVK